MKTLVFTVLFAHLLVETYQQPAIYPGCWTEWFDRDNPSATGDWETLVNLRQENPGKICDNPLQIEVLTVAGASVASTGDVIATSDTTTGFVCKNADQRRRKFCKDYKVRFLCPAEFCYPNGCWTKWYDRDDPSATGDWETLGDLHVENPGQICENPLYIEAQTTSGASVASTGDVIAVADPSVGFVCKNADQTGGTCSDYQVRFYCPEDFCNSKGCWTQWFDRDNPTATGDWETLENLYDEYPGKICDGPLKIEVLTTSGDSVASTGDVIAVSDTSTGFVCKNSDQSCGMCHDYKVRFFCPEEFCDPRGCWTAWFDRDNPSGTGDWELLSNLADENPGEVCENPIQIDARTTSGIVAASTGDVIAVNDPNTGFVCKNSDQAGTICQDYEVRFFCPEDFCSEKGCWTAWFDRDDPTATGDWETLVNLYNEYPGQICDSPLQIEVQTTSGASVTSTGDVIAVSDTTTGFVCKNDDQSGSMCHDYRVRFFCPEEFCSPTVCWTKWFDRDNPSGDGDWELLSHLRNENPGQICENPLGIEAHTVDTNTPAGLTGQSFSVFSPSQGFACRNILQKDNRCRDYKVRFSCPCPNVL